MLAPMSNEAKEPNRPRLQAMTLQLPPEYAVAIRAYAAKVSEAGPRVSVSAAGATVVETGLRALGLLPSPKKARPTKGRTSPRAQEGRP